MTRPSIRVPERVLDYMSMTGWGQGVDADGAADPVRQVLVRLISTGPANADGSVTVSNPSDAMLARLWFEADMLADGTRHGDGELADYNAALAMCRRVHKALGRRLTNDMACALMYGDR